MINGHLGNVVEYCECETCEHKSKKEKEPDDRLVQVPVFHVGQRVAGDVVAQPDRGDRDEDKVGRVEKGPGGQTLNIWEFIEATGRMTFLTGLSRF